MAASDDLDDIRLLIELLDQEDLLEIELEVDGRRVLVRSDTAVAAELSGAPAAAALPPAPMPPAPVGEPVPEAEVIPEHWLAIRSPMAGVFYRAPSPDAQPYVNEGDEVEPGDVLGLVEAMKVFNPIVAEVAGKVTRIVPGNEAPVEAEDALFFIEPQ